MSMTPKERILAVLNGEEPDKTPVCVYEALLPEHRGDWCQRIRQPGLGFAEGPCDYPLKTTLPH